MKEATQSIKNKKVYKKFLKRFRDLTKDPYEFLSVQPERAEKIKTFVKELYALNVREDDTDRNPEILPEIVIDGMDEEQIWQQIEFRNNSAWEKLISGSSHLMAVDEGNFALNLKEPESENDSTLGEDDIPEDEDDMSESEVAEEESEDEEESVRKPKKQTKTLRKSIVDDKFFKLSEMELFLNAEDEKERLRQNAKPKLQEDDIDYFNEDLSDEEEENVNYRDFFDDDVEDSKEPGSAGSDNGDEEEVDDNRQSSTGGGADEEDNEIDEENPLYQDEMNEDGIEEDPKQQSESEESDHSETQPKSSYEQRQERLKKLIEEHEEDILQEKPWQLKGEIVASGRPQNSLLEEVLEFEATTRPAPVITEETTLRLEDIVKQRIKDKAWDDVERKVKPIKTPQEFRKQLILDQEKSKESLAQVYEKEYQKAVEKLDPNKEDNEEEPKQHKEIRELMKALFNKLDALSNFHYTPKPVAPEPRIITNTPAVNMEEVAPVAVSDAKLLAPEEIKEHAKGDVIGKSERTRTDKNRERRKKKTRQRAIYKAREERLLEKQKQGLNLSSKEEKGRALKNVMKNRNVQKIEKSAEGAPLKSSKAFFTQLQDKTTVKTKKINKHPHPDGISAKRLKL